mmetsp:Transcript_11813/g.14729  ORF Transcript_11813/g.14729 Transcript_11813/m.14729 type:complete len:210 (+) Transcript_11813:119-748(+)
MIPHPPIPIATIHPRSILLLLCLGATYEIITRTILYLTKQKRSADKKVLTASIRELKYLTYQKRRLGPSAFVETSKLERKTLAKEREMEELDGEVSQALTAAERAVRRASIIFYVGVFALWYGVPLLSIDGTGAAGSGVAVEIDGVTKSADRFMGGLIFPLSYMGLGMKVARVGLGDLKQSSLGALVIVWAGQSVVDKVANCVEALLTL